MKRSFVLTTVFVLFLFFLGDTDACQIQYFGKAAQMFGSTPRGYFSNYQECENYRRSRPNFEVYYSKCVGCNSGASGNVGFGGGSFQQQIFNGLFQSFMNGFMKGLQQPSSPYSVSKTDSVRQKQLEKERKKLWQARIQGQIKEMERLYAQQKQNEFLLKKKSLLADLMDPEDGLSARSKALQQACMIELQLKVAEAIAHDDKQMLVQYRQLYDQVEAGDLSVCDGFKTNIPEPSSALADDSISDDFSVAFSKRILNEINMRLPLINQSRQKKVKAHALVEEKKAILEDLRRSDDHEKQDREDLLKAAVKELEQAQALEKKADSDLSRLENELDALKELRSEYVTKNSRFKRVENAVKESN